MSRFTLTALGIIAGLALSSSTAVAQPKRMSDKTLQERIEYRLDIDDTVGRYDIKVKVDNAQAWLSGNVRTAQQKTDAGTLANIEGISKVANDIVVNPDEDYTVADRLKKGVNKAGDSISDAWISGRIHWRLMGEDLLKDSAIKVDTDKGVVTLKGTVKSQAGRARATHLAEKTEGVKSVIDRMIIK